MLTKFKPDYAGIGAALKSPEVASAMHGLAERVAAVVRGTKPEADVVVDNYTTDRAASSVTIKDIRGRIWQVQAGILTRAAASVGLEVRSR